MRKTILVAICATAIGATPFAAFAQATGPSGQDSTKMGTGTTAKEGETKATGTQGMSKNSAKKYSMHKDGMKKDKMMKNEMKQ
jgi:pentapeptide MXKDX repeat protein